MKPDELAAWAKKFSKKGVRGGVNPDKPAPAPAATTPQRWPVPGYEPRSFANAPAGATWGPSRVETDMIVRPGPSAYADLLASVPDLAPDMTGGADAMRGTTSAETAKALRDAMNGGGGGFTVRDAHGNVVGQSSSPGIPMNMESIEAFPRGVANSAPVPLAQIAAAQAPAEAAPPPPAPEGAGGKEGS